MGQFGTKANLLIMNILNVNKLNQDNNQDILSRLSETRASLQEFCPYSNIMGISCPRS